MWIIKIIFSLFKLDGFLNKEYEDKKVGDAAVNKARLSADEKEIKSMREAKDFADRLTPASAEQLREQLNDRK